MRSAVAFWIDGTPGAVITIPVAFFWSDPASTMSKAVLSSTTTIPPLPDMPAKVPTIFSSYGRSFIFSVGDILIVLNSITVRSSGDASTSSIGLTIETTLVLMPLAAAALRAVLTASGYFGGYPPMTKMSDFAVYELREAPLHPLLAAHHPGRRPALLPVLERSFLLPLEDAERLLRIAAVAFDEVVDDGLDPYRLVEGGPPVLHLDHPAARQLLEGLVRLVARYLGVLVDVGGPHRPEGDQSL